VPSFLVGENSLLRVLVGQNIAASACSYAAVNTGEFRLFFVLLRGFLFLGVEVIRERHESDLNLAGEAHFFG